MTRAAARLTYPEAADYLRLSERTVRRLVAERAIPFVKVRRRVLFSTTDLDRYRDAHRHDLGDTG